MASALDAAHAAGLVHRDVKPTNMLLDVRPERPDHVYLSDFGLSRGMVSSATLTGLGMFLGTPDYVAPEQIEGKPVTGQTDQYALACAAFELLTGQAPFRRDEANAVIWSHLSVPPPSLTSLRPGLPAGADQVFARALAKAPADRYPRCADFAESLRGAFGLAPYAHRVIPVAEPPAADHPGLPVVWPAEAVAPQNSAAAGAVSSGQLGAGSPSGGKAAPAGSRRQPRRKPPGGHPGRADPDGRVVAGAGRTDDADAGAVRPGPATAPPGAAGSGATAAGEPRGPWGPGPAGPGTGPAATRRWLAAGAAVAAVVVIYLVIAAAAHAFPFAKPAHPIVQPTPPVTPIHQVTPATTPVSTPATTPVTAASPPWRSCCRRISP